jgi:RNA polymerase sigma factor (sigma-70 family)
MTTTSLRHLVRHLRRTTGARHFDESDDAELLDRFRAGGDTEAFEAIVRRHGAGVLSACRKVLPSEADVEDAFQATFLVLFQHARTIRSRQSLGGWLTGVAHRVALKAYAGSMRRQRVEQRKKLDPAAEPDFSWREACAILHEELDRLADTYRLPLLLCYLEGKSRDEAAQQLGCKLNVLRGRLERGRDRLRLRLTKRGVTLSAGLLSAVAGSAVAAAPPERWLLATLDAASSGQVPPTVAALLRSATSTWGVSKAKLGVALVMLTGLVSGSIGYSMLGAPPSPATTPQAPLATAARPAEAEAEAEADDTPVKIAGRVVNPEGGPVAGAKLFGPFLKKNPPTSKDDIGVEQLGVTDADGRFEVAIKKPFLPFRHYLVAHAAGFGVDWLELEKRNAENVMLKLVKDQAITGSIVDTEGKAQSGLSVSVMGILVPEDDKLDDYLAGWKKSWREAASTPKKRLYLPLDGIVGTAVTDKNGQFKLSGVGVERIVQVSIQGRGVAQATPYVLTRKGLDPKPYNEAALAALAALPPEFRRKGQQPVLYGPEASLVIEAGKAIEGVVKDQATGKPMAGVRVGAIVGFGDGAYGVTAADGHYRLQGLPQEKQYQILAEPPEGSAYLRRWGSAEAPPGTGTVRIDIELVKGVVVSGRVVDRQTGQGVDGGIRFAPLPENKHFGKPGFDNYKSDRTMQTVDRDGRFRVATIPGKSLVMVQTHGRIKVDGEDVCPYLTARPDPDYKGLFTHDAEDDSWRFTSAGGLEFLSIENVVKVVDLKEGSGEVKIELFVERGQTAKIVVQDAAGQPLSGVVAAGMTAHWPITYRLKSAEATVYALSPDRPRRLIFCHPEKKLGGTATVRGDEKEPVVIKLQPLGSVSSRFLEVEGTPLVGAEISLNCPDRMGSELYRFLQRTSPPVKTDAEGRFTLSGIVPGMKFGIQTHKGRTYYVGEPKIGLREVEPGKTLDLGDWKLSPRN